jgi:hypothetical protein
LRKSGIKRIGRIKLRAAIMALTNNIRKNIEKSKESYIDKPFRCGRKKDAASFRATFVTTMQQYLRVKDDIVS